MLGLGRGGRVMGGIEGGRGAWSVLRTGGVGLEFRSVYWLLWRLGLG